MRYIPRNCIQPNAILAKPILGSKGEILLREGVKMRAAYLQHMERLGIAGAYIHDYLSEGIEIITAISDELRTQAVRNISRFYSKAGHDKALSHADSAVLRITAEEIVDEILSHGNVMLNLFDIKVYDSYTYYHCVSVAVLSVVLGLGMSYSREKLVRLAFAALLHDVGKVFIDNAIINKPSALTPEEYHMVQQHPQIGYDYVRKHSASISRTVLLGVLDHHERVDGSGYPGGKAGGKITAFGRLIAVADVYDALISDRPYRKGMFAVNAVEYIQGNASTHFDFDIVSIFSRRVAIFPTGTCVMLSDGSAGLVIENFDGLTQRPLLRVFEKGGEAVEAYELNLAKERFDLTIISTVEM